MGISLKDEIRRVFRVLLYIGDHESSSITDISRNLGIHRAQIYTVLDALIDLKLVRKSLGKGIPRRVTLSLTHEGRRLYECLKEINVT